MRQGARVRKGWSVSPARRSPGRRRSRCVRFGEAFSRKLVLTSIISALLTPTIAPSMNIGRHLDTSHDLPHVCISLHAPVDPQAFRFARLPRAFFPCIHRSRSSKISPSGSAKRRQIVEKDIILNVLCVVSNATDAARSKMSVMNKSVLPSVIRNDNVTSSERSIPSGILATFAKRCLPNPRGRCIRNRAQRQRNERFASFYQGSSR